MQRIVQGRMNSHGKGKTYVYRFAVDSPTQNYYRISRYGASIRGVCHADEISYLFKNKYVDVPSKGTIELKSIERFVCAKCFFLSTHRAYFVSFYTSSSSYVLRFLFSHHSPHQEIQIQILLAPIWKVLHGNQLNRTSFRLNA